LDRPFFPHADDPLVTPQTGNCSPNRFSASLQARFVLGRSQRHFVVCVHLSVNATGILKANARHAADERTGDGFCPDPLHDFERVAASIAAMAQVPAVAILDKGETDVRIRGLYGLRDLPSVNAPLWRAGLFPERGPVGFSRADSPILFSQLPEELEHLLILPGEGPHRDLLLLLFHRTMVAPTAAISEAWRFLVSLVRQNERLQEQLRTTRGRLFEVEQAYQHLLEHLPQQVYRKDREGRFTFANRCFCEQRGCSWREIANKTEGEAFPSAAESENVRHDLAVMRGHTPVEGCLALEDGAEGARFVHYAKTPLVDANGDVIGLQSVAWDVSEDLRTQHELVLAQDAARESEQSKTRFLANMSHELRTPLNGIIGMAGLLDREKLDGEQFEIVSTIQNSAEHLLEIINEVLSYAKLEAGKLELAPASFSLNQLLEDLLDLFAHQAADRKIDFAIEWLSPLTPRLVGDAGKLRQILVNLIGNALKFTPTGSVVVKPQLRHVGAQQFELRVHVVDTGMGIPKHARAHLFQPFHQLGGGTTQVVSGTGLGLAICRQLVELMGGSLGLDDRREAGSDFWFSVKLEVDASAAALVRPDFGTIKRVLIVRARSASDESVVQRLAELGLEVTLEARLEAAASWIRGCQFDPHAAAVFLELGEEGNAALDMALRLSATEGPGLPAIILMAERGQTIDASTIAEAGLAGCIPRPLKLSRLLACLAEVGNRPVPGRIPLEVAAEDTAIFRRRHGLETGRVLVVEDNPVNQKLALQLLDRLGYSADPAGNGLEAVEALKQVHYPIVLMDCQMPVMDGWEATRLVRRLEEQEYWSRGGGRSYVIGLVNGRDEGDFDACEQAGMDDCLVKPFRKDELKAVMAQAVEKVRSGWLAAASGAQ